jgi:hypothetical protein
MKKIKATHPGKNLGRYLHKSKLPDKSKKIGATKLKITNQKNKLGSATDNAKRMSTSPTTKGY